ncbi:hypothetical protein LX36DRAFT_730283 [Colletotrichum falcatum]|nr:hypothetical protein LX36DRAFT_730283 [Colletotrichum falcatum]
MDSNQGNQGGQNANTTNNGGINNGNVGSNGAVKKKRRNRKGRECFNCRRGYYLAAGNLTQGIRDAIANCPPNNQARLGQLRILERINAHRPDGGDLTRRTQAAILNDITEVHEPMPSDETIVYLGDRCHNHLWYSALIRRNMVIPANWRVKPHVAVRLEKLRAVWNAVKSTPNLRQRSATTQVAVNQPAVNQPAANQPAVNHPVGDEDEDDEGYELENVEDDEHDLNEGLQQSRNQNAYPTSVPRVNQLQNMAMNPLAGYAINSMGQGYGQLPPDIAYGSRDQPMAYGGNPTPQFEYMHLQSPVYHGNRGGLGQNSLNRQMQPLSQPYLTRGPTYERQQPWTWLISVSITSCWPPGTSVTKVSAEPRWVLLGSFPKVTMPLSNPRVPPSSHRPGLTTFPTAADLGYSIALTTMGYADDGEVSSARGLASATDSELTLEPAALSGNGTTNALDMETGSDANSEHCTDGTDDDAGAADASTSCGDDGPEDDEIHDDSSVDDPQSEEEL